jgi:hypothetical protein
MIERCVAAEIADDDARPTRHHAEPEGGQPQSIAFHSNTFLSAQASR